jgi:hypothetical protein
MGKTEGSNEGPFSWIKGIKLKKTQHLDFIIKENGLVKRINTIFPHGWPTMPTMWIGKRKPPATTIGCRWGSAQEA